MAKNNMASVSGLNALPDSLLPHILSYLPTKEAVRAQLISKRWKNMWVDLPVLDFDFADFWSEDIFSRTEYSTYVSECSECHENFVRVIDDVLASRVIQQIDRFRLVWPYQVKTYYYHKHPVRKWILLVLQKNPQVLSIYVQPSVSSVDVPDTVFTCSSLEEMKLQIDSAWPEVLEPATINLPRLRKIYLGYYTINADFMSKLLLGCPNLEKLELYACRLNLSEIACGSLKSLVIHGSCNSMDVRVAIPSLEYLKVTVMSCQTAGIVFENMSSLVKASVCFLTADEFPRSFYNSEVKILNGLSGVTNLEIVLHGSESEGMLKHALKDCPVFKNLKAMHFESFDGCLVDCADMIDCLVQHSAILEHLSFYLCKDGSNKIELLEELRMIVCDHGNCQLVECNQAQIYDCLDTLMKELIQYMKRFEKMEREVTAEEGEEEDEDEDEDDDDNNGEDSDDGGEGDDNNGDGGDEGDVPWQEEEEEGEAGLAEEDEGEGEDMEE